MRGADAVAESLVAAGARYLFGLPGTGNLELLDAVGSNPGIEFISVRHEQAAAFMADGYARASGRFGVCTASRSSAANMALAVQNAYQDCSPVVALIGQVSREIRYYETAEQIDLRALFTPITKLSMEVPLTSRVAEIVSQAIAHSMSGRPRPVCVVLPMDLMKDVSEFDVRPQPDVHPPRGDEQGIRECLEVLCSASRPVIIAGGGVVRSRAGDELVRLAEMLKVPVTTTFQRKDAFPNRHELFVGMDGKSEGVRRVLKDADTVLAVGCKFADAFAIAPGVKLLHIDIDAGILGRRFVPDVAVQSDARLALDDMYEMARESPDLLQRNAEKRAAWASSAGGASRRDGESPAVGTGKNVDWSNVLKDIQPALDDGATMTVDQGAFAFHGVFNQLDFHRPGSLLAPAGGAMGFAFPAALGAQFALEGRKVICMCGDGGFAMSLPDLETAVRYDLPVTTVVANDRAYGLIAGKQLTQYDGRFVGSHLGKCDFADVADALGANGITVERTSQFKSALIDALDTKGPSVIDVVL